MPIGLAALIPAAISGIGSLLNNRKGDTSKGSGTSETTRAGTTTQTEALGPEAQDLLSKLLPQIMQMIKGGSVDPRLADDAATQQVMGANQSADAIGDTLSGNVAARGLTYSAPANMARGIAESFRGNAMNSILQNQANTEMDIARGNRQEQNQGLGLASNILNILPQSRTTQDNTTISGTNSQQQSQKSGSWIGDALQLGSNIYSAYKGTGQPGTFQLPTQPMATPPFNPAAQPQPGAPTLSAAIPSTPTFQPQLPRVNKPPYATSSITYDFDRSGNYATK